MEFYHDSETERLGSELFVVKKEKFTRKYLVYFKTGYNMNFLLYFPACNKPHRRIHYGQEVL